MILIQKKSSQLFNPLKIMITGVIKRNTLTGLIKVVLNTNSAFDYHKVSNDDYKHKTNMLIYAVTLFLSAYILLFLKLNMYSNISLEEYLIAFPIYTSIVLLILFITDKITHKHSFIDWLDKLFRNQTNFESEESILELRLNKIYNRCIEETYLTGTGADIKTIDIYIEGLQKYLKFKSSYSLKFTTPSNFMKIGVFFLAGFMGSVWSESFKLGDFSPIKEILSMLMVIAVCILIGLEVLYFCQFSLSEKKKINQVCEHLLQIKYMIIDSTRETL